MDDFYKEMISLKNTLEEISNKNKSALDPHDIKALTFMSSQLGQMAYEYRIGSLKSKDERFPYLGRIIVDTGDGMIPDDLAERIIKVEKKYIEL